MRLLTIWRNGLLFLVCLALPGGPAPSADEGNDLKELRAFVCEYEELLDGAVIAFAQDQNNPFKTLSITDQNLIRFCELGRIMSRGLANSFFVGTTDAWIVRCAFRDEIFAKAMGVTQEQLKKAGIDDARYFARATTEDLASNALIGRDLFPGWGYHRWLTEHLTSEQQKKLPQLYLHIEGLMALRRSLYRDLIGITLQEQKAIAKVVDDYERKHVKGHQIIHVALDPNEFYRVPCIEAMLRWRSANVDLKILVLLSKQQREKLYELVKRTAMFKGIQGPGAVRGGIMSFLDQE